jgi:N-acetylmuramoyl-L-alanine amidase
MIGMTMNALYILLLKSALVSGIMLGYYYLVLRNKPLHRFNRGYLLLTLAAGVVVPFLHFTLRLPAESIEAAPRVLEVLNSGFQEGEGVISPNNSLSVTDILPFLYLAVSVVLLATTVARIGWVLRLKRRGVVQAEGDHTIVFTDSPRAPFSFMGLLFWRRETDRTSDAGTLMLRHEIAHIKQRHTVDKLLMQAALVIGWANPFFWLLQREIGLVHEYLADEAAIDDNDTGRFAIMILSSHFRGSLPTIVHPFNSSIKSRIIMISSQKKVSAVLLRKILVLPIVAVAVFLLSFTIAGSSGSVPAHKKLTLVLDAAHGGADAGGTANGLKEKELTRRICDRLATLAGEYNIDIVQTRKRDEYLSLSDRAAKANRVENGLVLVVHVNKADGERARISGVVGKANDAKSGIEVIYSEKAIAGDKGKSFALRVAGRLAQARPQTTVTQKGLVVLKQTKHPAIAIEFGYIDNPNDMAILLADNRLDELCRDVLEGVVDFSNAEQ